METSSSKLEDDPVGDLAPVGGLAERSERDIRDSSKAMGGRKSDNSGEEIDLEGEGSW